ncbi:MAG: 6,7-dimethyl-8-ribityllumazine synthase, partial [Candidatus Nanopelagicales bacterium]
MSGAGAARMSVEGAQGMRIDIIAASWHDRVMSGLIAGAQTILREAGCDARLLRVPGAFELPVVAGACARAGAEAVVALGVVIRGGTPHFDYVCEAATSGLTR